MKREHCIALSLLLSVFTTIFPLRALAADNTTPARPNILFIAIDDLRPQLGCYGQKQMMTPNLDRLADSGVLFTRTYCQVSVCGASRASLMTGLRPTPERFRSFASRADKDAPDVVTLPGYFKKQGYHTHGMGKLFHFADDSNPQPFDAAKSCWSEPHWSPPDAWPGVRKPEVIAKIKQAQRRNKHIFSVPWEFDDCEDNGYPDGRTCEQAVKDLARLKAADKPFFLAVGFAKPHLPFTAPKKYWDLYDHAKIPLAANPHAPKNSPRDAWHNSRELRGNYLGIPHKGKLPDALSRDLVHAYYACVSYVDAQVGKLLDEVDRLGLAENTIVVVWGDHGWQLGEHGMWCKHCVFHTSMHSPLIVRSPGCKAGTRCDALTELVDLYPTLCDLASIAPPEHELQGLSFKPLLSQPDRPWKSAIFGSYGAGWAVFDGRYTYSEFRARGRTSARMLYDHQSDPDENVNVLAAPENAEVSKRLADLLEKGYKAALPKDAAAK